MAHGAFLPDGSPEEALLMDHQIREVIEQRELDSLSSFAAKSAESEGRSRAEPLDRVRTAFQRDRDRILHSKPFRRLKHKTQVFIDPAGDHYRTRLTHTLEVSQIARTISRALMLNEDLTEAIALGHDVGHTPFGHAGEAALDGALDVYWGERPGDERVPERFRHYEQSLRVLEVMENMNLTQETKAGIGGHSKGRKDLTDEDGVQTSTLEAAVVRISDRIAYMNHDLDDALRSRIIDKVPSEFLSLGQSHSERVGTMVEDVIVHSTGQPHLQLSPQMLSNLNTLKEWLFENVYGEYPKRFPDIQKAESLVSELFRHYSQEGRLPEGYSGVQGAIDFVAGMTDRFAIATFEQLRLPYSFRELPKAISFHRD